MSNGNIQEINGNNIKALNIAALTLTALENDLEKIDVISSLEVICDYLKCNDRIFDQNM